MKKNTIIMKGLFINTLWLFIMIFFSISCGSDEGIPDNKIPNEETSDDESSIRVMSYNIHYGVGMDDIFSLENIANVIKKADPDIVGLQEISNSSMAERLGKLTGMKVVFGQSLGSPDRYGDAILSKFPFTWVGNVSIPSASTSRYQAMAVDIDVPDKSKIRLINTHFDWLSTMNSQQARLQSIDVIEEAFLKKNSFPTILTGDLNSIPNNIVIRKMEEYGWVNHVEGRTYYTYSSTKPTKQIDYVLFRPKNAWKVKNFFVMSREESSDHLPVIIDLIIR